MIEKEKLVKILSKAYPQERVSLADIKGASDSITSHDVFRINFSLNENPAQVIFKAVPKNIRSPKRYDLQKEVNVLNALINYEEFGVPKVIYADFSKAVLDRDFFLMEPIDGPNMSELNNNSSREARFEQIRSIARVMVDIHNVPLDNFSFLPSEEFGEYFIKDISRINESIRARFMDFKPEREMHLLDDIIIKLRAEKPEVDDLALINGDISPSHIIRKNGRWYVLDWDPSRIGDRSWELYWFTKGVPEWVLGVEDGTDRLTDAYEAYSGKALLNSSYYKIGAVAYAYVYGVHILQNDSTHPHIREVPEMTSRMVGQLEAYLRN